jgi:hypothetical protein
MTEFKHHRQETLVVVVLVDSQANLQLLVWEHQVL